MFLLYGYGVVSCLWLLAWRIRAHEAAVRERQQRCFHRYEAQQTLRVNSLIGLSSMRVLPGHRYLVKHCRDCGQQTHRYSRLQDWAAYQADYAQESRDRAVEWNARREAHMAEEAAKRARPASDLRSSQRRI